MVEFSTSARRPETPALWAYVLDADDDLAEELDVRMRLGAGRVATAKLLDSWPGRCDLAPWLASVGMGPACWYWTVCWWRTRASLIAP